MPRTKQSPRKSASAFAVSVTARLFLVLFSKKKGGAVRRQTGRSARSDEDRRSAGGGLGPVARRRAEETKGARARLPSVCGVGKTRLRGSIGNPVQWFDRETGKTCSPSATRRRLLRCSPSLRSDWIPARPLSSSALSRGAAAFAPLM